MPVDMSRMSTADLEAIAAGNMRKVSDTGLHMLAGETPPVPLGTPEGEAAVQQWSKTHPGEIPGAIPGIRELQPIPNIDAGKPHPSNPNFVDAMLAGATAVPAFGLAAGAARGLTAGTRLGPYAARAAEALIPESGEALAKMTGISAVSGAAGEGARWLAEQSGAGPVGETVAGVAGGLAPYGAAGLVRGGAKAGRNVLDYFQRSKGAEVDRAMGPLRSNVSEPAVAAQGDLAAEASAAHGRLTSAEQRAAAISRAQEQLGGREPVATKRAAERAQAVERGLDALSPKGALAEDLGGVIQSQGRANVRALSSTRQVEAVQKLREPALANAAKREARGEFMATDPKSKPSINEAITLLNKQIEGTVEPMRSELRKRLQGIRGEEVPLTDGEQRVENLRASIEGRAPDTTKWRPITVEQADNLRRMLTDKDLAKSEGFAALDISRRVDVANLLRKAIGEFAPGMRQYLEKYRELSAPIAKATGGRGAALTEADLLAEGEVLFSADKSAAARYFLDGSAERAQRLLSLVGKPTPKLLDAIKGYARQQMQGMPADQMRKFIADHEGTLRVFKGLRNPLESIAQSQRAFEESTAGAKSAAGDATTRLAGKAGKAQQTVKEALRDEKAAANAAKRYEGLLNKLQTSVPEEAVANARSIAEQLFKDGRITSDEQQALLAQVADVRQRITDAKQAREVIANVIRRAILYGLGGAGLGTAGYLGIKAAESPQRGP